MDIKTFYFLIKKEFFFYFILLNTLDNIIKLLLKISFNWGDKFILILSIFILIGQILYKKKYCNKCGAGWINTKQNLVLGGQGTGMGQGNLLCHAGIRQNKAMQVKDPSFSPLAPLPSLSVMLESNCSFTISTKNFHSA